MAHELPFSIAEGEGGEKNPHIRLLFHMLPQMVWPSMHPICLLHWGLLQALLECTSVVYLPAKSMSQRGKKLLFPLEKEKPLTVNLCSIVKCVTRGTFDPTQMYHVKRKERKRKIISVIKGI